MNWFDSKTGESLVNFEQKIVQEYLEQKFGYYALQLGDHEKNLIQNAKVKHHIFTSGKEKNIILIQSGYHLILIQ